MNPQGMRVRFIPAADTKENWEEMNPVPFKGEMCVETDTGRLKFGDGIQPYVELPYAIDDNTEEVAEVRRLSRLVQEIAEAEEARQDAEYLREQLYAQLQSIAERFGDEVPVAELIADIEEIKSDCETAQHILDPGNDLILESGNLYRLEPSVESGVPWLRRRLVGRQLNGETWNTVVPGAATRVRLYFKMQGTATGTVTVKSGTATANKYSLPVANRTMQYSVMISPPASRDFSIQTPAGQNVKVWDLDWKVEV